MRLILLAILLVPLALAANDPGHDTLYIEQSGDSELTGNLNVSDEVRVVNLFYSTYLDILGNDSQPQSSYAQIYARSTGNELVVNAPTTITLARDSGSLVQIGASGVDLNVSGNGTVGYNLKVENGGILIGNAVVISSSGRGNFISGTTIDDKLVCLADGTNCPASGGGGFTQWRLANGSGYYAMTNNTRLNISGAGSITVTTTSGDPFNVSVDVTDDSIDGTELADTITIDGVLEFSGTTNLTDGNVSVESTFSLCFNTACTSRIYDNGSVLIIEGQ